MKKIRHIAFNMKFGDQWTLKSTHKLISPFNSLESIVDNFPYNDPDLSIRWSGSMWYKGNKTNDNPWETSDEQEVEDVEGLYIIKACEIDCILVVHEDE